MTATAFAIDAAPPRVTRAVVVGAGSVGRRHLRNLAALGIDAIALRSGAGQRGALDGWRTVWTWEDAAAFEPQLAIVANPTSLHLSATFSALTLGCHVLVEKPLADTLDGIATVASVAAFVDRAVIVGYQFRFHPTLGTVREWIASGAIGEVVSAAAHWGEHLADWHPDEDYRLGYSARRALGGGVVLTLSHPIDYLRWLLGEVESVVAFTARRSGLEVDVEDVASIALRFASGALATVSLNYAERPARHELRVVGTQGTIEWHPGSGIARLFRAGRWTEVAPPSEYERNALFVDELAHAVACAERRETPRCTLADGTRALEIALAALASAASGMVHRV